MASRQSIKTGPFFIPHLPLLIPSASDGTTFPRAQTHAGEDPAEPAPPQWSVMDLMFGSMDDEINNLKAKLRAAAQGEERSRKVAGDLTTALPVVTRLQDVVAEKESALEATRRESEQSAASGPSSAPPPWPACRPFLHAARRSAASTRPAACASSAASPCASAPAAPLLGWLGDSRWLGITDKLSRCYIVHPTPPIERAIGWGLVADDGDSSVFRTVYISRDAASRELRARSHWLPGDAGHDAAGEPVPGEGEVD
jgi:hypothetical protein